ncbi:MAG: MFS transporter [Eggerthellaceae bacterium]
MSAMVAGTASFAFFMDPVTSDLGFSRGSFSLYFSIVTITGTLSLPVYGRVISRFGSRIVAIVGGLWTGVAMALFSLCGSLPAFYFVAVLVGLAFFGCSYCAAPVIVDAWFLEKNGAVMGAAAACGGMFGVILGFVFPAIIAAFGWRMGYVAMGAMVLLLTVPAGVFLLKSSPAEVGVKPYGSSIASKEPQEIETCGATRAQAYRDSRFWALFVALVIFASTIAVTQHLAAYFVSIGTSSQFAGAMISVISAGIVITSILVGGMIDKIGLLKSVIVCSVLYLLSFFALPVAGANVILVCVALFFMAIGNSYNSIIAPVATSEIFGGKDYSAIWGTVSMACVMGQAIGAPLWGVSFDVTGGYQAGMYISGALNLMGMVLIVFALRKSH